MKQGCERVRALLQIMVFVLVAVSCSSKPTHQSKSSNESVVAQKTTLKKQLKDLREQLLAKEATGHRMPCSEQIAAEVGWLLSYTEESERTTRRLTDLQASLSQENQSYTQEQDKSDGAWGRCFTEFFLRLDLSADHIVDLHEKSKNPEIPTIFLDRINSPEKLTAYLDSLLISDLALSGRNHRKELNYASSALVRLILNGLPKFEISSKNRVQRSRS